MSQSIEGTFKGNPTLTLDPDARWAFTFGLTKARLIVEHIDAIKAFVAKHTPARPDRFDIAAEDDSARKAGVL